MTKVLRDKGKRNESIYFNTEIKVRNPLDNRRLMTQKEVRLQDLSLNFTEDSPYDVYRGAFTTIRADPGDGDHRFMTESRIDTKNSNLMTYADEPFQYTCNYT